MRCFTPIFLTLIGLSYSQKSLAGFMVAPSVKWSVFSLEPEAEEKTPNYQGVAPALSFGYSFFQMLDLTAFAQYTPGNLNLVKIPGEAATLLYYGGEIAARIQKSVYFAVRGGGVSYQLLTKKLDYETEGVWEGPAGGLSLGAISMIDKNNYLQVSLDFMHAVFQKVNREEDEENPKRRMDQFSISFTYVFNDYKRTLTNNFFGNYLNSFIFWE